MAVGGKKPWKNYIVVHLRPRGPNKHDEPIQELTKCWNQFGRPNLGHLYPMIFRKKIKPNWRQKCEAEVKNADVDAPGRYDDWRALHSVFVMGDIVAEAEQGFILPPPGQWGEWVQSNMGPVEERAKAGDEVMQALVAEVKNGLGKGAIVVGESRQWSFTPKRGGLPGPYQY
jgi:hypothetical protein